MKIVLRQKIVSLLASYTASDEQGKVVSLISQKFTVPASYEMLDAKGKLTYYLKGEIFNIKVEDEEGNVLYNIRPTKRIGLILSKRWFNFLKKELSIYNANGEKIGTAGGNWLAFSFKMKINGEEVARVKKSIMAFTDKYLIDVVKDEYADLTLISSVIFDALYNSNNKGRRR